MNKILATILTDQFIPKVADEGIIGIKECATVFTGNYLKRRNVGFGVIPSVSGGFRETKQYYNAMLTNKEHTPTVEAISFGE